MAIRTTAMPKYVPTDLDYNYFDDITTDADLQERLQATPRIVYVEADDPITLAARVTPALDHNCTVVGPPFIQDGKWYQTVTGTRDQMFQWFYEERRFG